MGRLEELLENTNSVAISGHLKPDGDCIGAVMAVYQLNIKFITRLRHRI